MMAEIKVLKQEGYNFLWIDSHLMMWDIPVERRAQKEIADKASGDVLVAGYGLGIVQEYLDKNPRVNFLLTIEKYPEVVRKCRDVYTKIYGEVIVGDFYQYKSERRFDCIIGDIWEDIVPEALEDYRRFRTRAQQLIKPEGRILAWGQDFFEYLSNGRNNEKTN